MSAPTAPWRPSSPPSGSSAQAALCSATPRAGNRVADAQATRFPARVVAEHNAAWADEPDGGELGRQGAVGALIPLESAGHDTSIRGRHVPDSWSVSIYADRYRDRRQGGPR